MNFWGLLIFTALFTCAKIASFDFYRTAIIYFIINLSFSHLHNLLHIFTSKLHLETQYSRKDHFKVFDKTVVVIVSSHRGNLCTWLSAFTFQNRVTNHLFFILSLNSALAFTYSKYSSALAFKVFTRHSAISCI